MRKEDTMETANHQPQVSIIIPAYNSERSIGLCLDAIRSLDYPARKLEVIVVDNGSRDQTISIARRHGARVLVHPRIFVSEMRNLAAQEATGEVLGFIDSDCLVSPTWLKNALRHLQEPSVAVAGCGYALGESPSWIERHWHYQYLKPPTEVNFIPAGNMTIKKSVFEQVGGFDPRLESGEDSDLCLRLRKLGLRIISDGAIKNIHLGNPKSLSVFLRKEIWYGKGLAACLTLEDWRDRTFLLANMYLASLLLTGAGILVLLFLKNALVFLTGLAGVCTIIIISTVYRTMQRRAPGSFFHLALLNAVYYLGRAISLVHVYLSLPRKLH